jgi:hypothetical protein
MVYGYLLCDTKIVFNFLGTKVHVLYDGGRRHNTPISTTLPSWWLTNKTMLKEGVERLQRYGEIIVELRRGEILLRTPRHPISSYEVLDGSGMKIHKQALIDLTKFRTLVLYSPSLEVSFITGIQCGFTRKHGAAIRRLTEFLENKGQHNEFCMVKIELDSDDGVEQYMPYDMHPLAELAGVLPALQIMLVTVKDGVDPCCAIDYACMLDDGCFRLIRELASEIFGKDGWNEEKFLDVVGKRSGPAGVLRIVPKAT